LRVRNLLHLRRGPFGGELPEQAGLPPPLLHISLFVSVLDNVPPRHLYGTWVPPSPARLNTSGLKGSRTKSDRLTTTHKQL